MLDPDPQTAKGRYGCSKNLCPRSCLHRHRLAGNGGLIDCCLSARDQTIYSDSFSRPDNYRLTNLNCRGLLKGFLQLGIEAELGQDQARTDQSDVCFSRSLIGDIVFRGKKFVGSAQTWSGSSLLQHGSILLKPQTATWAELLGGDEHTRQTHCEDLNKRMTSLSEILGHVPPIHAVKTAIVKGMAQELGVVFAEGQLTPSEWELAREIAKQSKGDAASHF